jgi:hypothetical protein
MMSLSLLIRRVYGRWPALGPVLYVATIQFFAVQLAVVLRFSPSYSLAHNTISDLGDSLATGDGGISPALAGPGTQAAMVSSCAKTAPPSQRASMPCA